MLSSGSWCVLFIALVRFYSHRVSSLFRIFVATLRIFSHTFVRQWNNPAQKNWTRLWRTCNSFVKSMSCSKNTRANKAKEWNRLNRELKTLKLKQRMQTNNSRKQMSYPGRCSTQTSFSPPLRVHCVFRLLVWNVRLFSLRVCHLTLSWKSEVGCLFVVHQALSLNKSPTKSQTSMNQATRAQTAWEFRKSLLTSKKKYLELQQTWKTKHAVVNVAHRVVMK